MADHIYPIYDRMLAPEEKESLLQQKGMVFWLTGLSGAGKSTLAIQVERRFHEQGKLVKLLDGDNIRSGINSDLGFTMESRKENIRRVAEIAKLFKETGIITLCTFICPTEEARNMARGIIGEEGYKEVYIEVDLAEAEKRDPKGLYKKARAGIIKNFTGIDSAYEVPASPDLRVRTDQHDIEACVAQLVEFISQECLAEYNDK